MQKRDFEYLENKLNYPAESIDTDYKSAIKFEEQSDFAAKLVKHILGFANSGGGYIIIGFNEKSNKNLEPDLSITDEISASYEVTRLCQHVEKYLLGQDRIKIEVYKLPSRATPIISIGRFPEYPFVCTKDYVSKLTGEHILEAGQIYIRTEGARTLTVKAPSEWRQLIRECIKASQEKEAKRPTLEQDNQWEKLFFTWVKNENDKALKEMSSAGFAGGFFKFIIKVPYGLNIIDNTSLLAVAEKSVCHNTGWPIGVVMTKPEYRPVPLNGGIRAAINTSDEFDYWAMNNRGHFFFMRSHQEDRPIAGSIKEERIFWFDVAIWRISEIICYTSNLCVGLNLKQGDRIKLDLYYEGLEGRALSVANPRRLPPTGKCKVNEFEKTLELRVTDIKPRMKDHVYEIAAELFGLFDFFKPDRAVVDSIVDEFLNSRL